MTDICLVCMFFWGFKVCVRMFFGRIFEMKGRTNMGITLQQLYDQTKEKFELQVLSGWDALNNEVLRLYYLEDIFIADWTRKGELLITTAMLAANDDEWLYHFVESVIPYEPSGLMINYGGYIQDVPNSVIDLCASEHLPLIVFPWKTVLQDVMQDFTNRIFETEQKENNIARAFMNAIFTPKEVGSYRQCMEKNGFNQYTDFTVFIVQISKDSVGYKPFKAGIKAIHDKIIVMEHEKEMICVYFDILQEEIEQRIKNFCRQWKSQFSKELLMVGIGTSVSSYYQVNESYQRAQISLEYCKRYKKEVQSFRGMGITAILSTAEKSLMEEYVRAKLGVLEEYDNVNQSDYLDTLECYLENGGISQKVSEKMHIHRNTVNYRIRKISELLQVDFGNANVVVEYRLAFIMKSVL